MAWLTENRRSLVSDAHAGAYLTDALKAYLSERYVPRYPTKRAVLLPALHLMQHEYGWIPTNAMSEIADFLGLAPSEVLDTASFYEEYWLKPKGKYLVQVCRSLPCHLCGQKQITDAVRAKLKIEPGETSADGKFTLVELECLGACGTAPVALLNETLYEDLTPESITKLLESLPEDPHESKDPTITWHEEGH